ncbi:protein SODIUM POTASSIUM ROOT DEFECTIVE 2 [Ricinus communis]|uniref:Chloroplast-targeted copper chaperone, putative n=1 Tax=Ricinus communis TaxID=3988 RepID=B9T733_RICCO|nr:protein SODIUM POTASSIUM ROOT DEFECTIVE 2 [Ricinus communis]EEF28330.1 chloroplast-targeted copper chaperone, putative [Ricinus communis]|eukprot:XP_002534052.1 protein SODIUM POTASSIUM ROOT DEFECTIVE 2 [Ricinus communis]
MKRRDMFCASQASTAICMSMDQPSSSSLSSSTAQLGGRNIDRHNPIIRDQKRTPRALPLAPCTSQTPPINPQPYHLLRRSKTSNTSNVNDQSKKKSSRKQNDLVRKDKKSSSKPDDGNKKDRSATVAKEVVVQRKSWAQPGDFITPPGSSRYLLSDKDFIDGLSDYDPILAMVPAQSKRFLTQAASDQQESTSSKTFSMSNSSERPSNQVVVLRVSLHCRGCEGKVRKHLSRMEGVSSFSIDFAAKKVTIVGDVSPLGVLASVSKVKSAQFWTPANPAAVPSVNSQLKK